MTYDHRSFRSISNSATGEVDAQTIFHYRQEGDVVWATYTGGAIRFGTLCGIVGEKDRLEFHYTHVNQQGEMMTGHCQSEPERLPDGRIRLHERWQWTSGDHTAGQSIVEEVE